MFVGRHAWVVAVLAAISYLQAPARQPTSGQGSSFIIGVVVDAVSGRPIPGAVVRLAAEGILVNRQLADSTGRFLFQDLPDDRPFALNGGSPGYFATDQFDNNGAFAESRPLHVMPSRLAEPVRLLLLPHAGIAGVVIDPNRRPLPKVRVSAFLTALIGGRQRFVLGGVTETDDRGAYELQGLVAGEYVVSAQLPSPRTELVFYPAAASPADARPLTVIPGTRIEAISLTLNPAAAVYNISGHLTPPASDGPLSVRLVPRGSEGLGRGADAAVTIADRNGHFQFSYVSKGSYTVRVTPTSGQFQVLPSALSSIRSVRDVLTSWGSAIGHRVQGSPAVLGFLQDAVRQRHWASVAIDVIDRDLNNVTVPLAQTATARIIIKRPPEQALANFIESIAVEPSAENDMVVVPEIVPMGPLNGEDELLVSGLTPGTYFIRTRSDRVAAETVFVGDVISPTGSFVSPERNRVTVQLSPTGEISGFVDAHDSVALDAVVFCFPTDSSSRRSYGFVSPTTRTAKPRPDGSFRLAGLAVGEYFVVAVRNRGRSVNWDDEAFIAKTSLVANVVRIRHDSPTRISLRVQTLRQ